MRISHISIHFTKTPHQVNYRFLTRFRVFGMMMIFVAIQGFLVRFRVFLARVVQDKFQVFGPFQSFSDPVQRFQDRFKDLGSIKVFLVQLWFLA